MKRVAFTIAYQAVHHLKHNKQAEKILAMFDLWIIIEGAASNQGSTSWCKDCYRPISSNDGTKEYLNKLFEFNKRKMRICFADKIWNSKDDMVNKAIDILKTESDISEAFLWQIDADEQWNEDQIARAEKMLIEKNAKTGMFLCDYYLSHDIYARGEWGEGKGEPYRRLWNWKGELFSSHEPPRLSSGNGKEILIPERFKHYAYYFEKDVHFKSQYYGGHENIYPNWMKLQLNGERMKLDFPLPISFLFGKDSRIGRSRTFITIR